MPQGGTRDIYCRTLKIIQNPHKKERKYVPRLVAVLDWNNACLTESFFIIIYVLVHAWNFFWNFRICVRCWKRVKVRRLEHFAVGDYVDGKSNSNGKLLRRHLESIFQLVLSFSVGTVKSERQWSAPLSDGFLIFGVNTWDTQHSQGKFISDLQADLDFCFGVELAWPTCGCAVCKEWFFKTTIKSTIILRFFNPTCMRSFLDIYFF